MKFKIFPLGGQGQNETFAAKTLGIIHRVRNKCLPSRLGVGYMRSDGVQNFSARWPRGQIETFADKCQGSVLEPGNGPRSSQNDIHSLLTCLYCKLHFKYAFKPKDQVRFSNSKRCLVGKPSIWSGHSVSISTFCEWPGSLGGLCMCALRLAGSQYEAGRREASW